MEPWDAAVVLCGGRSTRMGSEKALLDAGGRTLIERHVLRLAPRFRTVAVSVAADGASPGLRRALAAAGLAAGRDVAVVLDEERDRGPLAGVAAALAALAVPRAFFVAVDLPEVPLELVAALWERAALPGRRGCVPRWAQGLEPACAVYGRELLDDLRRLLLGQGSPGLKILATLPGTEVLDLTDPRTIRSLFPDGSPDPGTLFANLNSSEEYRRWREGADPESRGACP